MRAANEGVVDARHRPRSRHRRRPGRGAWWRRPCSTRGNGPGDIWLRDVAGWAWRVKLSLTMMLDLMGDLRARAQDEAIAGLCPQPQGPAAGSTCRGAADAGAGPRHPHRGQGGGGRCHRQAAGDRHALSVPAEERPARGAGGDPAADRGAWGRADRHRQRHRQPRDRTSGGRGAEGAAEGRQRPRPRSSCPRPAPRSIPPRNWRRANSPISTSRCAARSRSPGGCRIRWPNW